MTTEPIQYRKVKCRDCSREYVCTPADDYYDATNSTDGRCEQCTLGGMTLVHAVIRDGRLIEVPRPGSGVN